MRRSRKFLVAAVAVLALAVGGGAAFAQTETGGSFLGDVAERLGITEEELVDAVKAESLERVDEAVANGRLTEEQAERIRQGIEEGKLPLLGPHGPGHHRGGHVIEGAADYLGLTPAELFEELRGGEKTLAEIAVEQGKTQEGLEQAIVAAAEERLGQAVADGHLTEAQKADLLERLEGNVTEIVEGTVEPCLGRGFGPGPFGPPPADDASDEPAAENAVFT